MGGGERKEEEEGRGGRWKCTQRRKRSGMFSLGMRKLFCVCVVSFPFLSKMPFLLQDSQEHAVILRIDLPLGFSSCLPPKRSHLELRTVPRRQCSTNMPGLSFVPFSEFSLSFLVSLSNSGQISSQMDYFFFLISSWSFLTYLYGSQSEGKVKQAGFGLQADSQPLPLRSTSLKSITGCHRDNLAFGC